APPPRVRDRAARVPRSPAGRDRRARPRPHGGGARRARPRAARAAARLKSRPRAHHGSVCSRNSPRKREGRSGCSSSSPRPPPVPPENAAAPLDSMERALATAFRAQEPRSPASSVLRALEARSGGKLGVHLDSKEPDAAPVKITEDAKALRDPSGRYQ